MLSRKITVSSSAILCKALIALSLLYDDVVVRFFEGVGSAASLLHVVYPKGK